MQYVPYVPIRRFTHRGEPLPRNLPTMPLIFRSFSGLYGLSRMVALRV